jgi:hypothetical protein
MEDGRGEVAVAANTPANDDVARDFMALGDMGSEVRLRAMSSPYGLCTCPEKLAGRPADDTGAASVVRGTNIMPRPDVERITVGWVRRLGGPGARLSDGNGVPTSTSTLLLRTERSENVLRTLPVER